MSEEERSQPQAQACQAMLPAVESRSISWWIASPVIWALKASGLAHEQNGKLCEAFDSTYSSAVASVVPGVAGSVAFKSTPDGCCKERWEVR
jgi:hypothetical protein